MHLKDEPDQAVIPDTRRRSDMKNKSLRFMALSLAAVMALSDASIVTAAQTDTTEEIVYEGATDVDDEYTEDFDAEADEAEADFDGGDGEGTGAGGNQNGQNQEGDVSSPAPAASQTVIAATLEDHGDPKIESVFDTYSIADQTAEENVITVKFAATGLKYHRADAIHAGFYQGIGIPQYAGWTASYYYNSSDDNYSAVEDESAINYSKGSDSSMEADGVEGVTSYDTIYFDAAKAVKNADNCAYLYVKYTQDLEEGSEETPEVKTFVYKLDMGDVELFSAVPTLTAVSEGIITGPLEDKGDAHKDAQSLISDYSIGSREVSEDGKSATIGLSGDDLVIHNCGEPNAGVNGNGYWVGISIPVIPGTTTEYKQSYEAITGDVTYDSTPDGQIPATENNTGYDSFYFNADDNRLVDSQGYVYVKYTDKDNASDVAEYTIKVDMSDVNIKTNLPDAEALATIARGIDTATLEDHNQAEDKVIAANNLYKADSYTATAAVGEAGQDQINVSVSAEDLKYHYDGETVPKGGFWAGIAIPVVEGVDTHYLQSYTEVTDFGSVAFGEGLDSVIEDTETHKKTHDTVYFNIMRSDLVDNTGYVYALYTDKEDANKSEIVTYKIDFSAVGTEVTASSVTAQMKSITIAAPTEGSDPSEKEIELYIDPESRVILSAVSSDTAVAKAEIISAEEQYILKVTGLSAGETEVTVADEITGLATVVKVNVGGETVGVDSINIKNAPTVMGVGEKAKIEYVVYPTTYTDAQIVLESDNEEVIHVDQEGNIYALAPGKATVTVSTQGKEDNAKLIDRRTITVKPEASVLRVDKTSVKLNAPVKGKDDEGTDIVLKAAGTAKVRATVAPANAYTANVTWTIDDSSVASVDENGVITAKAAGFAVVTATLTKSDGSTLTQEVSVEVTGIPEDDQPLYKADALWIGKVYPVTYYDGIKQTPMPNVYYDSTLLTYGTDYTFTYTNNVNVHEGNAKDKKSPRLTVKFKGNYSGTLSEVFTIDPTNVTYMDIQTISAPVKTDKKNKQPVKQDHLKPVIMTWSGKVLKEGRDYELKYDDTREGAYTTAGDWNITISGKGNYADTSVTGTAIMHLSDVSENVVNIAKAEIKGIAKSYKYGEVNPQIAIDGLTPGEDYSVRFNNADKIGKASATITGTSDKCYGTKTVKFSIVKNPIDLKLDQWFSVKIGDNYVGFDKVEGTENEYVQQPSKENVVVVYEKSGVKPEVAAYYYYSPVSGSMKVSNKVDLKTMSGKVTVKGDGSYYKGEAVVEYTIAKQNLENLTIVVDDYAESAKAGAYKKNTVKIYDISGKELKEGKDYTLDWTGNPDNPKAGDTITVKAEGTGYYTGTVDLSIAVVDPAGKLSTGKALKSFKYKGSPVEPLASDFEIHTGKGKTAKTLEAGKDYEVAGYINNNKTGTATAIIKGTGLNSGILLVNYKITNK